MDWATLIPQLGIGVVALLVLAGVLKWGITLIKEMTIRYMGMLDERDKNYRSYVESNNHAMTNLVVEVKENIHANTEALGQHTELLHDIKEHFKHE